MKTKKNLALEGLRGLAAMIVILSHLAMTFWPTLHTGDPSMVRSRFDMFLFQSPLSFFYSGTFSVSVFFVMSGYVLSIKFVRTGDAEVIQSLFVKRYFRLMPPVLASALGAYALMKWHLIPAPPAELSEWIRGMYHFRPHFRDALNEGLWQGFLSRSSVYDPPAWTMQVEFLGSLLTFAACLLVARMKRPWIVFILLAVVLVQTQGVMGIYYTSFVAGIWIAHLPARTMSNLTAAIIFVLGAWLGGYHYHSFTHRPLDLLDIARLGIHDDLYFVYNALSGILIFLVVLRNEAVGRFCARFLRLGSYSFSIYLIHFPILASLGIFVFMAGRRAGMSYNVAAALASVAVLLTTYVVAAGYYRVIDKPGIAFSERMRRLLLRPAMRKESVEPAVAPEERAAAEAVAGDVLQPDSPEDPTTANISW